MIHFLPGTQRDVLLAITCQLNAFQMDAVNFQRERRVPVGRVPMRRVPNRRGLTRFNKIATQGAPQMAVDKEAISLSRVYSYYSKSNLRLFYVYTQLQMSTNIVGKVPAMD